MVASSSTRGQEAASAPPGAASISHPDPRMRQMSSRNDRVGRAPDAWVLHECCIAEFGNGDHEQARPLNISLAFSSYRYGLSSIESRYWARLMIDMYLIFMNTLSRLHPKL